MIHRILAGATLILCVPAAWSADAPDYRINYGVSGGLSYSDNVFLAPHGAERDSASIFAGLQLDGSRPKGRLRYDLATDLAAYKYLNEDVNQTLRGSARLSGSYDFAPEVFGWNGSVDYGQFREDLLRAVGPGNTDNVVSLSTGPTLHLRLSDQTRVDLDANYTRVNYSDRPQDSEDVGGRVVLMRQVGAGLSVGLGISGNNISYLQTVPGLLDYNRREVFITTNIRGVRTDAGMEAGYSQIKDDSSAKNDGLMFRGHLNRRLTPTLSASVNAVREYAISGLYDEFPRLPLVGNGGQTTIDETPVTVGARLTKRVDLGLDYHRSRTGVSLVLSRNEENGQFSGVGKRKYNALRGRVSRRLTPQLQGAVDVTRTDERFSFYTSKATENMFGGELNWSTGRKLGLALRLDHRSRNAVIAGADYSEFRASLSVNYGRRSEP